MWRSVVSLVVGPSTTFLFYSFFIITPVAMVRSMIILLNRVDIKLVSSIYSALCYIVRHALRRQWTSVWGVDRAGLHK